LFIVNVGLFWIFIIEGLALMSSLLILKIVRPYSGSCWFIFGLSKTSFMSFIRSVFLSSRTDSVSVLRRLSWPSSVYIYCRISVYNMRLAGFYWSIFFSIRLNDTLNDLSILFRYWLTMIFFYAAVVSSLSILFKNTHSSSTTPKL
jgi:hypothetical protein